MEMKRGNPAWLCFRGGQIKLYTEHPNLNLEFYKHMNKLISEPLILKLLCSLKLSNKYFCFMFLLQVFAHCIYLPCPFWSPCQLRVPTSVHCIHKWSFIVLVAESKVSIFLMISLCLFVSILRAWFFFYH